MLLVQYRNIVATYNGVQFYAEGFYSPFLIVLNAAR